MAHLTLIARASDGLPLSASIVNEEVRTLVPPFVARQARSSF